MILSHNNLAHLDTRPNADIATLLTTAAFEKSSLSIRGLQAVENPYLDGCLLPFAADIFEHITTVTLTIASRIKTFLVQAFQTVSASFIERRFCCR